MEKRFERETMLLGEDGVARLQKARVALFGVGGVGSYAAEALARSGVEYVTLVDHDTVSESNIGRQLCALTDTVGLPKVQVMAARMRQINPQIQVTERQEFFLPETASSFDFSAYDYVIDAIDTVSGKLAIAELAAAAGVPVISCMGTGNKLDPTALRIDDITKTSVCPLARVMRRELKKRGIEHLTVVWSPEEPKPCTVFEDGRRGVPGSVAFVPSVAGLMAAGHVVKALSERKESGERYE